MYVHYTTYIIFLCNIFQMELLTREVQSVFRDLLSTGTPWLSNATKQLAKVKVDNIVHNVGYPDAIVREETLAEEIEGVRSYLFK